MRDWLATLLQVSYSARSCGENTHECLSHWRPLLHAMSRKCQRTMSEILCDALVRSLQMMDECELSTQETNALALTSKKGQMGSSLIETKLDDHSLSYCFSFLNVSDVCNAVEQTSHRFLQVSRNMTQPFHQGCLYWRSENGTDEPPKRFLDSFNYQKHSPFKRLIHSRPYIPKVIALRSLMRFQIDQVDFDPRSASVKEKCAHTLDFEDVMNVIGKNVQRCHLGFCWYDYSMEHSSCLIPLSLSDVTDIHVSQANFHHLTMICQTCSKCEKIEICDPYTSDLSPLNTLSHLRSLTISDMNISDLVFDASKVSDVGLISNCFPNLTEIEFDADILPFVTSLLTTRIISCDLGIDDSSLSQCTGNLSKVKDLTLRGIHGSMQSRLIKKRLKLPTKIPKLKIGCKEWDSLSEWVGCVDELTILIRRYNSDCPVSIAQETRDAITNGWSVRKCSLVMSGAQMTDLDMVRLLYEHENTRDTQFTMDITRDGSRFTRLGELLMS